MTNTRKILAGAIAAAAFAATAVYAADNTTPGNGWRDCTQGGPGAASAQRGGMGGSYGPGSGHGNSMMDHGGFGTVSPAAMLAGHLAALKVELKITREQESAWEKFAINAGKQAATMPVQHEKMRAQMAAKDVSAPERLAQRTEIAKQHIVNMENMTAAVKDLYTTLSPEQKKIADDLLVHGSMGGMGHRRGLHS
jgi:hypothetical protein